MSRFDPPHVDHTTRYETQCTDATGVCDDCGTGCCDCDKLPDAVVSYTAGHYLKANRVVALVDGVVVYADKDTPTHESLVVGMTAQAALDGGEALVKRGGLVESEDFDFPQGARLYLGNEGYITADAPSSGFTLWVGGADSEGRVVFRVTETEGATSPGTTFKNLFIGGEDPLTLNNVDASHVWMPFGDNPEAGDIGLVVRWPDA